MGKQPVKLVRVSAFKQVFLPSKSKKRKKFRIRLWRKKLVKLDLEARHDEFGILIVGVKNE